LGSGSDFSVTVFFFKVFVFVLSLFLFFIFLEPLPSSFVFGSLPGLGSSFLGV